MGCNVAGLDEYQNLGNHANPMSLTGIGISGGVIRKRLLLICDRTHLDHLPHNGC